MIGLRLQPYSASGLEVGMWFILVSSTSEVQRGSDDFEGVLNIPVTPCAKGVL